MIAVISADLLGSSSYSPALLEKVIDTLRREFNYLNKQYLDSKFTIFRGDSFQGIVPDPAEALRVSFHIKSALNRLHQQDVETNRGFRKEVDLRLAIGIGSYDFIRDSILESNGQAFQLSGRTLDEMKKDQRKLRLTTPTKSLNAEFNTSFFLFDVIAEKWSTASAEVIYYLLRGFKETEIGNELGISQSAVNQRKKAAGWEAIECLLNRYEFAISQYLKNGK